MTPLIVYSHLRWNQAFQRPQQILSRLCRGRPVVFVEEPDAGAVEPRLEVDRPLDGLTVLRPQVPGARTGFHEDHVAAVGALVRGFLHARGLADCLAWLCTPMALPLALRLPARHIVYDCMEDLGAFRGAPSGLAEQEDRLLALADLVFTASASLYEARRDRNANVHCFPGGMDPAQVGRAREVEPHPALGGLPWPRLGYHGVIDERLDLALLAQVADQRPDWAIVLVGPVGGRIEPAALPVRPNIHWLGDRPDSELPQLLAGWNVCLMPIALDEPTRGSSPTETPEYLAAGLPVVSTPMPDVVRRYQGVVEFAGDADTFVQACEKLLGASEVGRAVFEEKARRALAGSSWDATVERMEGLLAQMEAPADGQPLQLWGGLECTVNRVGDTYFSQMERNGHVGRIDDIERFASLGVQAIRYPILWERVAPRGVEDADWTWTDERLEALRRHGVRPIAGLLHHGSGPRHTSLVDPAFPEQLAEFAGAVARRYPWLGDYTPVNEPLTTARFSGLYGVWYPHGKDDATFLRALINQCRGVVLAMRAIRQVNPHARLVQTDDLGKTHGTPAMRELVEFYNERRWLSWDLLCGKVGPAHPLWPYLMRSGIDAAQWLWFADNPCPPDVIGVNYYITSERWLDDRAEAYPARYRGQVGEAAFADVEAPRVSPDVASGIGAIMMEAWERYRLPVAVTEVHLDAPREDQMRWLLEVWHAAEEARRRGADVRAVTVWALLGSYDWNCLVTASRGYYEPGPFDVRGPEPRPTAVAGLMREIAAGREPTHPVLQGSGALRALPPLIGSASVRPSIAPRPRVVPAGTAPPLLIVGGGALGVAFERVCKRRNIACHTLAMGELPLSDPKRVEEVILRHRPWAIVYAGGELGVEAAEGDAARSELQHAFGPVLLSGACAKHGIQLLTFSSDQVFDGLKQSPYVETDGVAPLNAYGRSKAAADREVLQTHDRSLVLRTSGFFGPWDRGNFLTRAMTALDSGRAFAAANDIVATPVFLPDLVNVALDLMVDRETGLWHVTHAEPVTWAELAWRACDLAGIGNRRLQAMAYQELDLTARRPAYSALASNRSILLPALDDALARFLDWDDGVLRLRPRHAFAA